jgi:hypothetical protein
MRDTTPDLAEIMARLDEVSPPEQLRVRERLDDKVDQVLDGRRDLGRLAAAAVLSTGTSATPVR